MCAAAVCVLGGCTAGVATGSMSLTVSTTTDAPVTLYVDTHQRGPSGLAGGASGPTPVELSPQHPSTELPVPYNPGNWLRARVAAPPDRPPGITVGCQLRAGNGRLIDVDATSPLDPVTDIAHCEGAG